MLLLATMLVALAGCQDGGDEGKFHVEGTVKGAEGEVIYLEAMTVDNGVLILDSMKLGEDGKYAFAAADTTSCPELYRLRIADQIVNFCIDSTENVRINAQWPDMAYNYTVEGSGASDTIRILSDMLKQLQYDIRNMSENRRYTPSEREVNIREIVREYKDSVKINFIQNHYGSASSYYALFQAVGNVAIWDLENDASDVRWANAVANAWMEKWPGSLRAQNLYHIVMKGHANTHPRTIELNIDDEKIKETGIIDMGFPDITGKERRLSDLRGKVVLLDFTVYEGMQERTMRMRQLYDKYQQQGFEIYQVSLDASLHYWKQACQGLPWVCVYSEDGAYTDMLRIYAVQQIPSFFLIDRDNNLVKRGEFIENLEAEIEALL